MPLSKILSGERLQSGYADTSTRKHPVCPETVIVGEDEISSARCVGHVMLDGSLGWLAFKVRGKKRYYFQYRPW